MAKKAKKQNEVFVTSVDSWGIYHHGEGSATARNLNTGENVYFLRSVERFINVGDVSKVPQNVIAKINEII